MSVLLEVQDLRAGYGRAEVLHGLSFSAQEKSVVTVIGPNGAGKSTLLGALMGLIPSRSAALRFAGEDIARLTLEERVLAGLALVPEKRELFGTMSVEDNLLLGGWRPRTLGDRRWRDGLESVYARFPRLKERRAQVSGYLSGGEQQMLAIGRALMSRPKVVLLDEPSLGLAPMLVEEIFGIVSRLVKQERLSVLLVEQNAAMALTVAEHGYVMENGRIVLEGPAAKLRDNSDIKEFYLGLNEGGARKSYHDTKHYKRRKRWLS